MTVPNEEVTEASGIPAFSLLDLKDYVLVLDTRSKSLN